MPKKQIEYFGTLYDVEYIYSPEQQGNGIDNPYMPEEVILLKVNDYSVDDIPEKKWNDIENQILNEL